MKYNNCVEYTPVCNAINILYAIWIRVIGNHAV